MKEQLVFNFFAQICGEGFVVVGLWEKFSFKVDFVTSKLGKVGRKLQVAEQHAGDKSMNPKDF